MKGVMKNDVLNAIAPFVEEESYIEMRGEDDVYFRWVFRNGKVEEIYPEIIWKWD